MIMKSTKDLIPLHLTHPRQFEALKCHPSMYRVNNTIYAINLDPSIHSSSALPFLWCISVADSSVVTTPHHTTRRQSLGSDDGWKFARVLTGV